MQAWKVSFMQKSRLITRARVRNVKNLNVHNNQMFSVFLTLFFERDQ